MKHYCNMVGKLCRDIFSIPDDVDLVDCIHPAYFPNYDGNQVPDYVRGNWNLNDDGDWIDNYGVIWHEGVPQGPTPEDPNYTGPWPITEEEPETPEEPSE